MRAAPMQSAPRNEVRSDTAGTALRIAMLYPNFIISLRCISVDFYLKPELYSHEICCPDIIIAMLRHC
jgi:hypothetical protein